MKAPLPILFCIGNGHPNLYNKVFLELLQLKELENFLVTKIFQPRVD